MGEPVRSADCKGFAAIMSLQLRGLISRAAVVYSCQCGLGRLLHPIVEVRRSSFALRVAHIAVLNSFLQY